MGYKVGHKRETVAKATKTGSGVSGAAGKGGGKGNQSFRPKLHKKNKLV